MLAKEGYKNTISGRATEKINLNENGYIAQDGEAIAGAKSFSLNGLDAGNNFTKNHNVILAFMKFAGGYTDSQSAKFAVTWEVA